MSAPFFAAHYVRPDLDAVLNQTRGLAAECRSAANGAAALDVVSRWNQVRSTVDTNLNVAHVRYHQNTADDAARTEQDFWNDAAPVLRELDVIYARALLDCPHRDAIGRELGEQLLRLKECSAATFAPEIKDALAEEARLSTQHVELTAQKEVAFRGEKYTMAGVHKFFGEADRQTRLEAHQARERFLADHAEEFDGIYDRLVALRHGMAGALGLDSFTPLGYRLMTRVGYGPDEVARFRDALRAEIVPLCHQLHQRQRERLGVDTVRFHDENVWDLAGNPKPTGNPAQIVEAARNMYRDMHPDLGAFMDMMMDKDLLDVEQRDGKAPGGFCTNFADLGVPFVFAQFTGTADDLQVLTHECGHAFQAYSSAPRVPVIEYVLGTYEAAEVHSMSMEFLTFPYMERFFGADAERYRRTHLERALVSLPYIALVDHFQHDVYATPTLTPAQRNQRWRDLEATYLPWRDYGPELPHLGRGTVWQRQSHIYQMPFYYIDYALAGVCALQFFAKASTDRAAAMDDYMAICQVGGSLSFTEMLEVGKLESPFDPACLATVAAHSRSVLGM
jgi:M3 family oligoendopeptidase